MRLEWIVPEGRAPQMLRSFVRGYGRLSASLWKRVKWQGRIAVNGIDVHDARHLVLPGDVVAAEWEEPSEIVPADIPLSVVYEDEWLLIVDKPAQMLIHPTTKEDHATLVNAAAGYFAARGEAAGVHPVYRLDRNTTGLVVIAKSAKLQYDLTRSHDLITRHYIAFAAGHLADTRGEIDRPIGRKDGSIVEWQVREDGKPARTTYEVIGRGEDFDVLRLRLYTGRTHQIRVHLAYLGHPLLGDGLYGGTMEEMVRQALHAADVAFLHPVTGKAMHFTAPLPADMARFYKETKI